MKITDIMNFSIEDDHAVTQDGLRVYFFRLFPPNLTIMTEAEKRAQVEIMREFFDSLPNLSLQFLSIDKTENLSENKKFWQSLLKTEEEEDPCREIKKTIISDIDSIESTSASVGRAFYFMLKTRNNDDINRLKTCMSTKNIKFDIAKKQEIVTVLRNYLLREFVGFDLYDWEKEVEKQYENLCKRKKRA